MFHAVYGLASFLTHVLLPDHPYLKNVDSLMRWGNRNNMGLYQVVRLVNNDLNKTKN